MGRFVSGIGIRLAIVGVIAVGGFLLRDRLSSNAGDLQVGDCFDDPAETLDIEDVQHHPCGELHTAEVIYVGDMPAADDAPYPSDASLFDFASARCVPAFQAYTGLSIDASPQLDFSMFYPNEDGWSSGEREATCYVVRLDGGAMTGSVKAPTQ